MVVMGDLGRSPRMQYHAVSLAKCGYNVSLVGSTGEPCVADVVSHPGIVEYRLSPAPWCGGAKNEFCRCSRKLFLVYAPFKVLFQILQLLILLLFRVPHSDAVLVQNPPSIPTLVVVWIVCRLRRSRFIIDWHNFGYTILEMTIPPGKGCGLGSLILRTARVYELMLGRCADAGLCVTHAMKKWLHDEWKIEASVLHDRPPSFFRRTPIDVRHELFSRLRANFEECEVSTDGRSSTRGLRTLFTETSTELRKDRPALILSSTSWTPDEDFGVLLNAIDIVAKKASVRRDQGGKFPSMVFVVTGKGPQREYYEQKIAEMELASQGFHFLTMWLEASDYPLLLGSADLGVCLHTSSSGLDLPMKVVDMFGCRLPVCAIGFKCLDELVKHGENGLIFKDANSLADQIFELFQDFPQQKAKLETLADGVGFELGWHENWIRNALPIISGV